MVSDPYNLFFRIVSRDLGSYKSIISSQIVSEDPHYRILDGEFGETSFLSKFDKIGVEHHVVVTDFSSVHWIEDNFGKFNFYTEMNTELRINDTSANFLKGRRSLKYLLKGVTSFSQIQIGSYGRYDNYEPVIDRHTEGYLVEVKSLDQNIPTTIFWYGEIQDFGNIQGFLDDQLDYENYDNNKISYLGNAGSLPTYFKCGDTECDVYYAEVLAGRFYVGYLYTLNNSDIDSQDNKFKESAFCP